MNRCPSSERLSAFAMGNLGDVELHQIAQHLESCRQCDEALAALDRQPDDLVDGLLGLDERSGDTGLASYHEVASSDGAVSPAVLERCIRSLTERSSDGSATGISFDAGKHYSRLLLEGVCRLGRFELLEEVGVGSFGHVFRARDTELSRVVAVKIQRAGHFASDDEAGRFLREARSAAALVHPSIVSLHDTGRTEEGVCFLVTEYIEGTTLDDRLKAGRIDHRESATMVAQIADALHYAHQHGVVHRDIKPSNILIDRAGKPNVTDFGLAKLDAIDATLTSDGRIMGTPAYMSPEHARGAAHQADARTDVYSLGVMLYEMLTGERPFQGAKRLLLLQVLEDEPRAPRQLDESIPRDLETICLKAMSKSPQRRYQSAKDLGDDLRRFLVGDPIAARPANRSERLVRWCRKYPFAVALFAGITIGSLVGFGYLRYLQTWFVQEMAVDSARQYSDMLEEFTATYSDARGEFFAPGEDTSHVPPALPSTLQIEVAERISKHEQGMRVRMFSPYSFRNELRPNDGFETSTLGRFRELLQSGLGTSPIPVNAFGAAEDGDLPLEYYEFVSVNDRPYLKYARGQIMKESCLHCHNTHKDSPKTDWREGDLAGVLTLTRPLQRDIDRTTTGFRGASLLMISVALVLAAIGLAFASRTRGVPASQV